MNERPGCPTCGKNLPFVAVYKPGQIPDLATCHGHYWQWDGAREEWVYLGEEEELAA